jgi:hypothetical protein
VLQQPEDTTLQVIKQGNAATVRSKRPLKRVVNSSQDGSNILADHSRSTEVVAHNHVKDPSSGLFVDDLIPANHTMTVGADIPSPTTTSDEDVIQAVPSGGSFAFMFAPIKRDQDTADTREMQTSDMGYFWPIGQRVKKTKRGVDSRDENSCAMKRARV